MRAPYECQPNRIQYVDKMRGEYTIVLSGCVIVCFNKNSVLFTLKTRNGEREKMHGDKIKQGNSVSNLCEGVAWNGEIKPSNAYSMCVDRVERGQSNIKPMNYGTIQLCVWEKKKTLFMKVFWRHFQTTIVFYLYKKYQPKQNLNHRRDFSFERGKMFLMKEFKLMNINGSISINWKII